MTRRSTGQRRGERAAWLAAVLTTTLAACQSQPAQPATEHTATVQTATANKHPGTQSAATGAQATGAHGHACGGAACGSPAVAPPGTAVEGGTLYGNALDPNVVATELAMLLGDPTAHVGQVVRATGTITRACQHRGCWLELGVDQDAREGVGANLEVGQIRVPMAGHAFLIPPDSVGRRATVEGTLRISEAAGTPVPLIEATGVVIAAAVP